MLQEELNITPRAFHEVAVLDEPRPAEHGEAKYHVFIVTAWDGAERQTSTPAPSRRNR